MIIRPRIMDGEARPASARALHRPARRMSVAAALFVVVLAGACAKSSTATSSTTSTMGSSGPAASSGPASSAPSAGGAAGSGITIHNFAFSPQPLKVAAGATVEVTNADGTAHTVTADDGSFDTGSIAGGGKGRITAPASGTVKFHCAIHNYMTGVIQVGP